VSADPAAALERIVAPGALRAVADAVWAGFDA
jgi:hypothetical protein